MADKVLSMNEIHKINGSAKMNRSAKNSATAHTLDRSLPAKKRNQLKNLYKTLS